MSLQQQCQLLGGCSLRNIAARPCACNKNLFQRPTRHSPLSAISGRYSHRVVMIPLATPDEAVLLENLDDLPGNLVSVEQAPLGVGLRPSPIVSVRGCNIDGDPQTVRTFAIRACDQAAVVGPLRDRKSVV